jgi:hypothetical protein
LLPKTSGMGALLPMDPKRYNPAPHRPARTASANAK